MSALSAYDYNSRSKEKTLEEVKRYFHKAPGDSGYFLTEPDRTIIHANGPAIKKLGFKEKQLQGRHISDVLYKADLITVAHTVAATMNNPFAIGFYLGAGLRINTHSQDPVYTHYQMSTRIIRNENSPHVIDGFLMAIRPDFLSWNKSASRNIPVKRFMHRSKNTTAEVERFVDRLETIEKRASPERSYSIDLQGFEHKWLDKSFPKAVESFKVSLERLLARKKDVFLIGVRDLPPREYTLIRDIAFSANRKSSDIGLVGMSPTYEGKDGIRLYRDPISGQIRFIPSA